MTISVVAGTIFGPLLGALIFVIGSDIFSTRIPCGRFRSGALFVVCVLGFPEGSSGRSSTRLRSGGAALATRRAIHCTAP